MYKQVSDVWVYVSGGVDENEILLYFILSSVLDALTEIGKGSFDKQTLMDNMDMVFLAIDELLDSGYCLLLLNCCFACFTLCVLLLL